MLRRACRPAIRGMMIGCLAAGLWAGTSAVAQDQTHPPIQLDLQRLIESNGGGQSVRFQDSVWTLRPEAGRWTVLLPIRVTSGDAAYELSRPSIGVRSARFIGWYIPEPAGNNNNASRNGDADVPRAGDSRDLAGLLLGEDTPDDRGRDELSGQVDALDAATDGSAHAPVPDGAPRLSRKVTIHPDGSFGWEMDRTFTGAESQGASQNNLYGYKIDPRAMQDAQPPRPERLTRQAGESSREYAERRRQQQEDNRDAQDAYRALREEVRELPEEFREDGEGVVYAVFDAPDRDELSYTGDDPLPWQIDLEDMAAIADLASGRGGGGGTNGGLDAQTLETVQTLLGLAQRGGVMDHRAIAIAVYQSGLAARVTQSNQDAGYGLLRVLATSDDDEARAVTLGAIARVQPPTRASAQLLADAARDASGDMADVLRLAAMRSAFRIEAGDDGNAGRLITQVNDALAASRGPSAADVLEEAIDAMGPADNAGSGRGAATPPDNEVLALLITGVEFDNIPESQMQDAIAVVIRRAPDSALAAGWLDRQLLRASDTERADLTLRLLSRADGTSRLIRPLSAEVSSLVFGPADPGAQPRPRLTLDGVIPLDSEQHGLIAALTSGDPERRELAWEVLRHFELVGNNSAEQGGVRDIFDRIVGIGLDIESHPSTPPSLVDFIDNQTDSSLDQVARTRMLELVMTEGLAPETARRGARRIVYSGRDYGQALAQLDADERGDLVSSVYMMLTGDAPPVVRLVGDAGQADLLRWLAEQWLAGRLPDEQAWADAVGDHDRLLRLAGSDDPDVAAAAAAAMVLRAGGTPQQQTEFIQTVASLSDRSPESISAAWEPIRRDIFAEHLSDAAGPYRLTLDVFASAPNDGGLGDPSGRDPRGGRSPSRLAEPATNPGGRGGRTLPGRGQPPEQDLGRGAPAGQNTGEPTATYDLGIVQLTVDGDQVALSVGTVPIRLAPERLALRIDDISTLAGFDTPGLDDLPLSQLAEPIDLLPTGVGTWAGTIELSDGRVLRVTLARER